MGPDVEKYIYDEGTQKSRGSRQERLVRARLLENIMIKVFCHTNIDKHHMESWPENMATRPVIGDFVKSAQGVSLRVVSISHCEDKYYLPYLDVELHN